ncbi:hypothetical protein RN001_008474 [Aquatica leii]|uniref:Mitochondrial assembly of ribosomal large subunit protein 1 n=1 Tax=Aquatica leii TaxID=1421715 RepID=A0AAN7PAS7_9COLE|nr:hypothetical protein RN001_008474 [Aquatica leii]
MIRSILRNKQIRTRLTRSFCEKKNPPIISNESNLGDYASKYEVFRDEDSEIILDVIEEREKYLKANELETHDPFKGLNLERGKTGVFDIEDLVEVLKRENADDIFVSSVPTKYNYVDFICLASGRSQKHLNAIIQFVRRVYKCKRHDSDEIPKFEGKNSKDWLALDLGNIALHVFSKQARALYDLDSLWALGPEFDKECNKKDPMVEMLEKHSIFLQDLKPADVIS